MTTATTLRVCRTANGHRLHLTPDRVRTLCDHAAVALGPAPNPRFPEAADHWLADDRVCQGCRSGQYRLLHGDEMRASLAGDDRNVYAEEARAVTAARMAHLARRHLLDRRIFTIEELAVASPEARRKLKALAQRKNADDVRTPSDRTWAIMLTLLRQPGA